ncbi:MAG: hypothetical protein FJ387_11095 [Verrucomicrobia bacterium]|nr:hypothetical protein [Verrucomicrobiota bacterium]
MNKLSKEKRDRLIVVGFLTATLSFGIWYLLVSPLQGMQADNAKRLGELEEQIAAARWLATKAVSFEEDLQKAQTRLEAIEETMPGQGFVYERLFGIVQGAAQQAGLTQEKDSTVLETDTDLLPDFPYKSAEMAFELVGWYHQLGRFLAELENKNPFLRFQVLAIQNDGATAAAEKLRLKLKVIALVRPPDRR